MIHTFVNNYGNRGNIHRHCFCLNTNEKIKRGKMNNEIFPESQDSKSKIENFFAPSLQAIASSKALVKLIVAYLKEKDEEKRKLLLVQILAPRKNLEP